ncbi:MAG: hypothetical protein Q9225_005881 [Loekoesia sp. 1 TL-2023]
MPTDAAIAKFLYTIMKQLDLKSIDWNTVANELDITNGHAARMRYSRFKQQMEGPTQTTRKPRVSGAPRKRKAIADGESRLAKKRKKDDESQAKDEKPGEAQAMTGTESNMSSVKTEQAVKLEAFIKPEPVMEPEPRIKQEPAEPVLNNFPAAPLDSETSTTESFAVQDMPDPLPDFFSTAEELQADSMIDPALLAIDQEEAKVKTERELGY